jgi:Kef-type K+ transport system membrane component KefB
MHDLGIDWLGLLAKGHLAEIAFAMATALSVAVSGPVNAAVRRLAGGWNFLLRTALHVVLFVVGYPLLTWWARKFALYVLSDQKPPTLLFLTATAFFAFGLWADNQRRH